MSTQEAAAFVRSLNEQQCKVLFPQMAERWRKEESTNLDVLSFQDVANGKKMQFVRVPTNTTDESFAKCSAWVDHALQLNAGGNDKAKKTTSAKRLAKKLMTTYREAFEEAMAERDMQPPERMNAVKIAAMFKASNITTRQQRRALLRHLRHHFGKSAFDPEHKVQLLCEGHTEVKSGFVMYAKVDGEQEERVDFHQKNIADKVAAQLTRQLNHRGIVDPSRIYSIDVMAGGDHGKGAFIFGAKVAVVLHSKGSDDEIDWDASFDFEISVAEIVCEKDSADIIAKTIKDELTIGLKTIATQNLLVKLSIDDEGKETLSCFYSASCVETGATVPIQAQLYIVGDLAMFGMVLGKEGMSGKWCHLCKMSGAEMSDLLKVGELWKGMDEMNEVVREHNAEVKKWKESRARNKSKNPPPPKLGMKYAPWWDFIPLEHYIVPLLHCEIGIGDLILSSFRNFVSEKIEYISTDEANVRRAKEEMEDRITHLQTQREAYKDSSDGKAKVGRARKALTELGAIGEVPGVVKTSRKRVMDWNELFDKINSFVEDGIRMRHTACQRAKW